MNWEPNPLLVSMILLVLFLTASVMSKSSLAISICLVLQDTQLTLLESTSLVTLTTLAPSSLILVIGMPLSLSHSAYSHKTTIYSNNHKNSPQLHMVLSK